MGDCFRGHLDLEQAVHWWGQILQHEPDNQALWTRVGDALVNLDRLDDAVYHYESSLKAGYDLYAYLGLARAEHKRENYDKAKEHCQQALKDEKGAERALETLIQICEAAGDTSSADEARQKLASLNP